MRKRQPPSGLQVHAAEGTVTLTGSVDNERALRAAEHIAMHSVGVLGVINQIMVDSGAPPPSDEAPAARAAGAPNNAQSQ